MSKKKSSGLWINPNPSLPSALFDESLSKNNRAYYHYYNKILEMALARFQWFNLPLSVDERYLEITLLTRGQSIFFQDDVTDEFLALQLSGYSDLNVYKIPKKRVAIAANGYQNADLTDENSVLIFNNYLRRPCDLDISLYAEKLANIDRTIDINVNAQKTPLFIKVQEKSQELTMQNLYAKYEGNIPVIFVDKALTEDSIRVLKTDAPFLADKLLEVKNSIWTEVLTYLGIANTMVQKKERLIRDEVQTTMGGTFANRFSALGARQQACKLINDMFGLDVWVDFRSDETIPSRADVNPVTGELIDDIDKSTDNNGIEGQTDLTNVNRQTPNEVRDKT